MTDAPGTGQAAWVHLRASRHRTRFVAILAAAALGAAGLGTLLAFNSSHSSSPTTDRFTSAYRYYRSVISPYGHTSMMKAGYAWMMSSAGYTWIRGGATAPGWMRGEALPGFMMSGDATPGTVMGRLFADAPGPRVSESHANTLGDVVPAGARPDHGANRLTFISTSVHFVVLASPSMAVENFRIAGMSDPTVVVPRGAKVSIEFVNADTDTAHGFVVTAPSAGSSWMPMMTAPSEFTGSALWFLGASTSAGMHERTLTFTAARPGTYLYLCPVPGHAEGGMAGTFIISGS